MNTFREKVIGVIDKIKSSKKLSLLAIILLIAAIPLTVFIAQQAQDVRQRANTNQAAITVTPNTPTAGTNITINWTIAQPTTVTSPTTVPTPAQCSPRPPIVRNSVLESPGKIRVDITAGNNTGRIGNVIKAFRLNTVRNVNVVIGNQTYTAAGTTEIDIPDVATTAITINQITPGQEGTLVYDIIDACGAYPDTRGGGPTAWGTTTPTNTPIPTIITPTNTPIPTATPTRIPTPTAIPDEDNYFNDPNNNGSFIFIKKAYAQTIITGAETMQLFKSGTNEPTGRLVYLNCLEKGVNVTPPATPQYTGTCQYPLSPQLASGSYIIRMFATDGTTEIGESIPFTITGSVTPTPVVTQTPGTFSVKGVLFVDANTNQTPESTETKLQNQTVKLYSMNSINDANPVLLKTTPTDIKGDYAFNDIVPGFYRVEFATPSGYMKTTESSVPFQLTQNYTHNFSIRAENGQTLKGVVFEDTNANGQLDTSDTKLIDQIIQLSIPTVATEGGVLFASMKTDAQGAYTFPASLVPNKLYRVKIVMPTGYERSIDNDDSIPFITPTTGTEVIYNFGIKKIMSTPTPTPTSSSSASITFNTKLYLTGIGSPSGTFNPIHPQRNAVITLFDTNNMLIATRTGEISYASASGSFTSTITSGQSNIPAGNYIVKIQTPQFLRKQYPGIFTIQSPGMLTLPSLTMTTGDINLDNVLNILDYNMIIDCYNTKISSEECKASPHYANSVGPLADLNDDGIVDGIDYNLFIRSLATQEGD